MLENSIFTLCVLSRYYLSYFRSWESKLVLLQEILDDWLRVQATWMYLEPVFAGSDIQQLMPEESRRFGAVDKIWKELMKQVHLDAAVMSVVEIDKMLEKLKKAFSLLETIQKGLNSYLDMKRLYFARLFFLSNDGVLEILADTKDPKQIQPHLRKCFDGICSLTFNDSIEVTTMKSAHGEEIHFSNVIVTSTARGQVEKWLLELEKEMKKTILLEIQCANQSVDAKSFTEWLHSHPGQCTQIVKGIIFTKDVDGALSEPSNTATRLNGLAAGIGTQLTEVIQSICSGLTGYQLINTQNTLIQLKQMETIVERLISKKVSRINDFEWLGQMRYYLDDEMINLKMLTSKLAYGFEYIGNSKQFVSTAATDRCYRAIFVALNHHFGIAVQGCSASGKSEMITNLAKINAKYCVAFNCANDFNGLVATNYLKGMIACGAWVCLDQLNVVSSDNLSVIANQVQIIRSALEASHTQLVLDNTPFEFQMECGLFATLNPSISFDYSPSLPENLKTSFRLVSIGLPDLQHIIEIELLSYGFQSAASLAVQIYCVFELCGQQITRKPHYDFSIRTIRNLLKLCEKRAMKSLENAEEQQIYDLIRIIVAPTLVDEDIDIFDTILRDVFPNIKLSDRKPADLKQAISDCCKVHNIQDTEYFIEKVLQLREMLQVHVGVMIVGETFSGKTAIYRILGSVLGILEKSDDTKNVQSMCRVINPKSITISQLYGKYDVTSNEWKDGILAINFREMNRMRDDTMKWLIFDGAADSLWMDNIHSLLDDNRTLCLMSGDMIQLRGSINLIFEPLNLTDASPSIVRKFS